MLKHLLPLWRARLLPVAEEHQATSWARRARMTRLELLIGD